MNWSGTGRRAWRCNGNPSWAWAVLILVVVAAQAGAVTRTVGIGAGYNFNSIQAAIDAAASGDMILVYPGTYDENIDFDEKNIVLTSTNPGNPSVVASTIIDGGERDGVVVFDGVETSAAKLTGFTIQNGRRFKEGGGIFGDGTQATIEYCVVQNNSIYIGENDAVRPAGAGIYDCDGLIQHNTVVDNIIYIDYDPDKPSAIIDLGGAGLALCDGTIRSNVISRNNANSRGGGLYDCNGIIEGNEITENEGGSYGGGIYSGTTNAILRNNTIEYNSACYGGGIAYFAGEVRGNDVQHNTARVNGGGMYACSGFTTLNNISYNDADRYGGGIASDAIYVPSNYYYLPATFVTNAVDNLIAHNSADGGGGLALVSGIVARNRVMDNTTTGTGGAVARTVYLYSSNSIYYGNGRAAWSEICLGRLWHDTVYGNSGGGVINPAPVRGGFAGPTVLNSILWSNASPGAAQVPSKGVSVDCSVIEGWKPATGTTHNYNISTREPYLKSPETGDFGLEPWSPAIDLGTGPNSSQDPDPDLDFDHDERGYNAYVPQRGGGSDYDAGAQELRQAAVTRTLTVNVQGEGSTEMSLEAQPNPKPAEGQHVLLWHEEVQLKATAATGWQFDHWEGSVNSTDQTIDLTVENNMTVTAVFVHITYTLTMEVEGEGTVNPPVGTHTYNQGDQVVISATPAPGWVFDGWQGGYRGTDNPAAVTINRAITVKAVFKATFPVEVSIEGGGSTDPAPGQYIYDGGSQPTFTAFETHGWRFSHWRVIAESETTWTEPELTITVDKPYSLVAVFEQYYVLTINVEGGGTTDPEEGVYEYDPGTVVNLTASPLNGDWVFSGWTGSVVSDASSISITMSADKQVTAHFLPFRTLTLATEGEGEVTPGVGDHLYPQGTLVQISATPADDWVFDYWKGDLYEEGESFMLALNRNISLTAVFRAVHTVWTSHTGRGAVSPAINPSRYVDGTKVTFYAEPESSDWVFKGWEGDIEGMENPRDVVVIHDMVVVAKFEAASQEVPQLATAAQPPNWGTTSPRPGVEIHALGTTVSVKAMPNAGYRFDYWELGSKGTSRQNPITVTIEGSEIAIAHFKEGNNTDQPTGTQCAGALPSGPGSGGPPMMFAGVLLAGWLAARTMERRRLQHALAGA